MYFFNLFRKSTLSAIARRIGYVRDQQGILNRYVRESENWNQHLEHTKSFVLESVQHTKKRDSIAFLGSGWLLDVPLDEITKLFDEVYLYDIVHPEQVVVKTKKMKNVHLVTCDLTGGAVALAENSASFEQFVAGLSSLSLSDDFNRFDMVVSVNILNQLDIILCDYLLEKFSVPEDQLIPVRQFVQQFHVDMLPIGKTCVITDFEEENESIVDGSRTNKNLLHCAFPAIQVRKEWTWIFDTKQRYHRNQITKLRVMAFNL
ncbi:MAG: hypothetical protein J6V74_05465 [Bacteroidales bacterium]|nr:hypothetical protein [Bacteroidales bacterium]